MKLVGAAEAGANRWDQAGTSGDPVALLERHRPKLAQQLAKIDVKALNVVAKDLKGTQKAERKFLDFMCRFPPGLQKSGRRLEPSTLNNSKTLSNPFTTGDRVTFTMEFHCQPRCVRFLSR
jgi:hypothetical protein